MAFEEKKDSPDADGFKTVGWLSDTSKDVLTVKDSENNLLGFIAKKTFAKFVKGEIKGCPIRLGNRKE